MSLPSRRHFAALLSIALASLAGCKATENPDYNVKPSFIGTVSNLVFDGLGDDLLTGSNGVTGLQSATAPAFIDPANPTVGELRRLAIYNNYRALVDTTTAGGFGVLYGPNVDANGAVNSTDGKIPGNEYITFMDDGTGKQNVTLMVQVPLLFNRTAPCIVTATSSGSRGIYGAIATAGEWGLKRGCAVAYVDKGTGMGVHDLASDTVNQIDGTRASAATAGAKSTFTASLTAAELAAYNAAFPNRIAVKHAHSQQNPERDWGLHTLRAVEFALWVLNEQFSQVVNGQHLRSLKAENVLVIASSVSNGAGAALAALEQDTQGLIDGVAVAEPNIQMVANNGISVRRGSSTLTGTGRPLYDYFSFANLMQPCAALAASVSAAPGAAFVSAARGAARCASLKSQGLLAETTTAGQADEALAALRAYGWESESSELHASHYAFATPAIAVTYANSYGRFGVRDNLCGLSFAATGADFKPAAYAGLATIFSTGNGIPPMAGINIINNNSVGGALLDGISVSPTSGTADYNADGARCLRNLFTGTDTNAQKVAAGINEVRRTGNLRGKPAIIVHGRSDALIPVSFTSRPYFGLNKTVEGVGSKLVYIEVTNAQHFDAFIGNAALPGYDTRFVPLHRYFNQAMDLLYNNLRSATALPPSQVVRTVPRGGIAGEAPAITAANVPLISASPATADQITFGNGLVTIPD